MRDERNYERTCEDVLIEINDVISKYLNEHAGPRTMTREEIVRECSLGSKISIDIKIQLNDQY